MEWPQILLIGLLIFTVLFLIFGSCKSGESYEGSLDGGYYEITWSPPAGMGSTALTYDVKVTDNQGNVTDSGSTDDLYYQFYQGVWETAYTAQVRANNSAGAGPWISYQLPNPGSGPVRDEDFKLLKVLWDVKSTQASKRRWQDLGYQDDDDPTGAWSACGPISNKDGSKKLNGLTIWAQYPADFNKVYNTCTNLVYVVKYTPVGGSTCLLTFCNPLESDFVAAPDGSHVQAEIRLDFGSPDSPCTNLDTPNFASVTDTRCPWNESGVWCPTNQPAPAKPSCSVGPCDIRLMAGDTLELGAYATNKFGGVPLRLGPVTIGNSTTSLCTE